jgi:putative tryptophan/tyrosine transport system substrate-binding protein
MGRLIFSTLMLFGIVAWSPLLYAQKSTIPVIGFISTAPPSARGSEQLTAFHKGLQDSGYAEGRNVRIEYRWASDDYSLLRTLAEDLVKLRVDVIVAAGGHVSAIAAHKATTRIPVVFTTVTDPVKDGLVASLNRPGGNATGTAGLTSELDAKRLEYLIKMKPTARVIGVLVNPDRPGLQDQETELQDTAGKMKLVLEIVEAKSDAQIEIAFQTFADRHVDAVLVTADPLFINRRGKVLSLVARYSFPTIYQWREFVTAGGLMSYGPSITEAYRLAGINAVRILKGEKPADIPVVQPTRFYLVINLKTAKQLGLELSPELLPDEVLE